MVNEEEGIKKKRYSNIQNTICTVNTIRHQNKVKYLKIFDFIVFGHLLLDRLAGRLGVFG